MGACLDRNFGCEAGLVLFRGGILQEGTHFNMASRTLAAWGTAPARVPVRTDQSFMFS